jgi:small subunit ribosomal protein S4
MNNYKGAKLKLSRRLGVPIAETPKHSRVLERRKTGFGGGGGGGSGGQQKQRRRKQKSIYSFQLDEKQKLTFYYNIGNRQLRRYMDLAKKDAASTADVLIELLETRLDNVVRRLGWARTIWQARQLVSHGHIMVNGKRCSRPGYAVCTNDILKPRNEACKKTITAYQATAVNSTPPQWLTFDGDKFEAHMISSPKFGEIQLPFDLKPSMVIEFFSK